MFADHLNEALIAGVSAFVTAIGTWYTAKRQKASAAERQQTDFYAQVMAECQTLRNENSQLKIKLAAIQDDLAKLTERLEHYESNPVLLKARRLVAAMFDADPNPKWIHVVGRNQWYLNLAYCEKFGIQRASFWTPINIIGQYDQSDALRYLKHDLDIVATGVTLDVKERVRTRILDPACDEYYDGVFRKKPVVVDDQPYIIGEML